MKWLILLTLFAACTTKQKPAPAPESPESEAKPVSPYTVKPCYCQKIFFPVCADGINYGNSCEAECHGHKTWTDGNCAEANKKKK